MSSRSYWYALSAFSVWLISAFFGSGITLYDFTQNAFCANLVGLVGLAIEQRRNSMSSRSYWYALSAFLVWLISAFFGSGITLYDFTQNTFYAMLVGMVGLAIEQANHTNHPPVNPELDELVRESRAAKQQKIDAAIRRGQRPW